MQQLTSSFNSRRPEVEHLSLRIRLHTGTAQSEAAGTSAPQWSSPPRWHGRHQDRILVSSLVQALVDRAARSASCPSDRWSSKACPSRWMHRRSRGSLTAGRPPAAPLAARARRLRRSGRSCRGPEPAGPCRAALGWSARFRIAPPAAAERRALHDAAPRCGRTARLRRPLRRGRAVRAGRRDLARRAALPSRARTDLLRLLPALPSRPRWSAPRPSTRAETFLSPTPSTSWSPVERRRAAVVVLDQLGRRPGHADRHPPCWSSRPAACS